MRLYSCVMDASDRQRAAVLAEDRPKLVVTTYVTENLIGYAAFSIGCIAAWTEKHGYALRVLTKETSNYEPFDARWNKVEIVRVAALEWAANAEYILWVDADLIVLDLDLTVEDLVAPSPHAEMWLSAENKGSSTFVNTGSFLIRNSPASVEFLAEWWNIDSRNFLSDQESFDKAFIHHRDIISVLPPNFMNTDPPAMTNLGPKDRVLHLMGELLDVRKVVFERAFREICTSQYISPREQKHQLGINTDFILKQTLAAHGRDLKKYIDRLRKSDGTEEDEETIFKLQASCNNYGHAKRSQGEVDVAQKIDDAVFKEISRSMRKMERNRVQISPELLKRKIVQAIKSIANAKSVEEAERVYSETIADSTLLESRVVKEQLAAVLIIRSSVELNMAHSYVGFADYVRALDKALLAEKALDHEDIGEHNHAKPLATVANLMCANHRYHDAQPIFERILRIQSDHFGADHPVVATIHLNAGICHFQGDNFDLARIELLKAKKIYDDHNIDPSRSDELSRVHYFLNELPPGPAPHTYKADL